MIFESSRKIQRQTTVVMLTTLYRFLRFCFLTRRRPGLVPAKGHIGLLNLIPDRLVVTWQTSLNTKKTNKHTDTGGLYTRALIS